jgi:hypothetical protein
VDRKQLAAITVPETTRQAYAVPLEQLAAALADYPKPPSDERPQRGGRKVALYCRCPRPRPVWTSASEAARGGIRCEFCGEPFTARS